MLAENGLSGDQQHEYADTYANEKLTLTFLDKKIIKDDVREKMGGFEKLPGVKVFFRRVFPGLFGLEAAPVLEFS